MSRVLFEGFVRGELVALAEEGMCLFGVDWGVDAYMLGSIRRLWLSLIGLMRGL